MYINTRPFLHTPKKDTARYQNEMMDILKDIEYISGKYDIDYTLEAGSALGALRHKGFIPWDNDADILMSNDKIKSFIISLAKEGLFDKYEIWYYDCDWGWMIKDIYLEGILKDPESYCSTSLDWVIDKISYAIFRVVKKDTVDIEMSLSKGADTYQVAHFDPSLSTASLAYNKMLPEEKRTWRKRFLKDSDVYQVHGFVDVFPTLEFTPEEYIKIKKGFKKRDFLKGANFYIKRPQKLLYKLLSPILPLNHVQVSASHGLDNVFEDYRVGVNVDYKKGIDKARKTPVGDKIIVSKAPWNLRKIMPYYSSELYPPQKVEFEGELLSVPNKAHEVLTNHYKNYMEFPPEGERIQHSYHLDPSQFKQVVDINE